MEPVDGFVMGFFNIDRDLTIKWEIQRPLTLVVGALNRLTIKNRD
jgi:hypothetical protein